MHEPTFYSQAKQDPVWVDAINKELSTLEVNDTWELTKLSLHHKDITSKWVYKLKFNPGGYVKWAKARLVIRGFNQQKDVDYSHTFSPVAKLATVRVSLDLATTQKWHSHQLGIK